MRGYDLFLRERETSEVLPNGCRVHRERKGPKPVAAFFFPKARKPVWNFSFKDEAQMERKIAEQSANYDAHVSAKIERRGANKPSADALAKADPGAIFSYSWGYDQTNIDYFQVVKRSGSMVTIAAICAESVDDSGGPSQECIRASRDAFIYKCGATVPGWGDKPTTCGQGERARSHDIERPDLSREYCGHDPHEYEPVLDTQLKRVTTGYNGEPMLSFSHGCGKLVNQVTFGNAPPLVVSANYRTAFGWGH